MKLGIAVLRTIVGTLFMGHDLQKLAGWFGGQGLEGTGAAFESLGLGPGRAHAAAAGTSETVGGALLAGGLLAPPGATLLSGTREANRPAPLSSGPPSQPHEERSAADADGRSGHPSAAL